MFETRLAKIVMVAGITLFAVVVTFNNLTDYNSNFEFVRHVLSMDTTFPGNALMYRAITVPALWNLAYWMIIAGEGITAIAFATSAVALWRYRAATAAKFHSAKRGVVIGATIGFVVWFVGFMVVGGEWFAMWQSHTWNGQQAAFRFYLTLLGVLIFVNQPDSELYGNTSEINRVSARNAG